MSHSAAGSEWAVASPHSLATDAAADAFDLGGNALDAAVAAATTLAVVYPHMCGIGGDLIALVRDPSGRTTCILSAGAAPATIDPEDVRSRNDGEMPSHGPDAITVPGAAAGWRSLHQAGAVLPWAAAFERAIEHARHGVPISRDLAAALSWDPERLRADPGILGTFFRGNSPIVAGDILAQPALASTLGTLAEEGASAMYGGDLGRRFANGLQARGSHLSDEDLAGHQAQLLAPLEGAYQGNRVFTSPPPSQGFVLLRILGESEKLGLEPDPLGGDAAALARVFAGASALRDEHLADPPAMRLSVEELMERPIHLGTPGRRRGTGDTISLMCADARGWAVSLIQSLYDGFGSGILEPGTGIVAHDRGACFTLERGHPNELTQGKRPAHTLMPVMVERPDSLVMIGTMGGEAQPQINAQNLMRLVDQDQEPAEALSAPRWTVEGTAATVESDVPAATSEALASAGFTVEGTGRHSGDLGHSNLIVRAAGAFEAASDPRADGSARAGS